MSSSLDDLHPGYGPRHSISPTSPYGNFVRKRSYPMSSFRARQDPPPEDTQPLTPKETGTTEYFAPHSSDTSRRQRESVVPSHDIVGPAPTSPGPRLIRQLSHLTLSSPKARAKPSFNQQLQHEQMMEDQLTFFQRHFTKPIDHDPEKIYKPSNRRFALLTRGFIVTAAVMLLVLLAIIGAALGVTLNRQARESKHPSPIRAAIMDNFPDPALWYSDGTWYAFGTNNAAGILERSENQTTLDFGMSNIQLATSTDFVKWNLLNSTQDPLPVTGDWAVPSIARSSSGQPIPRANVWAPGVVQRSTDSKFIMYYSASRKAANASAIPATTADDSEDLVQKKRKHPPPHCIGASVSDGSSPMGPYNPINTTLACPLEHGGAIDPAAFIDKDGTLYVSYKVDGNNIGNGGLCGNTVEPIVPTPIMLQKMHPNGTHADGEPVQILDRDDTDGPLIEAPDIVRGHDGIYYLFFSSGCTRSPTYDIKYATAMNVTGPYTRAQYPLLMTGDWGLLAPGSPGIHDDGNGGWNMAFHARVPTAQGRVRAMFTTKLKLENRLAHMLRDETPG